MFRTTVSGNNPSSPFAMHMMKKPLGDLKSGVFNTEASSYPEESKSSPLAMYSPTQAPGAWPSSREASNTNTPSMNCSPQSVEVFAQQNYFPPSPSTTQPPPLQPPQLPTSHSTSIPPLPVTPLQQLPALIIHTSTSQPPPIPSSTHHQHIDNYSTLPRVPRLNLKYYKDAKRGQIIVTPEGIKRRYNGNTWRRLCYIDDCLKESQRCGFCYKHRNSAVPNLTPHDIGGPVKCNLSIALDSNSWKGDSTNFSDQKRRVQSHGGSSAMNNSNLPLDISSDGDENRKSIGGDISQDGQRESSMWDEFSKSEQITVSSLGSLSGNSGHSTPFSPLTSPPTVSPMTNSNIFHFGMRGSPPCQTVMSGMLPIHPCTSIYQQPHGHKREASGSTPPLNSHSNFSSFDTSVGFDSNLFYQPISSTIQTPTVSSFVNTNTSNSYIFSLPMSMHDSSHFSESKVRRNLYIYELICYAIVSLHWLNRCSKCYALPY